MTFARDEPCGPVQAFRYGNASEKKPDRGTCNNQQPNAAALARGRLRPVLVVVHCVRPSVQKVKWGGRKPVGFDATSPTLYPAALPRRPYLAK